MLLGDSLLRGGPLGTLLLWSVHRDELVGIPSRPFWRAANRTSQLDDQQVGKAMFLTLAAGPTSNRNGPAINTLSA